MADFLLEIGCEEIPARMLDSGAAELARRVGDLLKSERLVEAPEVESLATPRRLAVLARNLRAAQPDVEEQVTGPSVQVAFKDGKPTPAAAAFAKKVGLPVDKLQRVKNPKGEYLSAQVTRKGRPAAEVLAEALPREVFAIHWAKNMYWRGKAAERFVRPVRWVVALLDGRVVPLELGGVRAGAVSRGHRTLGATVTIARAAEYTASLEKAGVIARPAEREQRIRKALDAATRAVPGARWREDAALLSTVVNLTEFPSVILGNFDGEFLALPEEVLVTVMRDHQKYFAVEDAKGKLASHFLAVLNTDGDSSGTIRHGHERVLRARFADARFFWESDQKILLKQRVEMLKAVTLQKDLGSYYEKAERVAKLANQLAADLAEAGLKIDRNAVNEAAWLAKTDLTSELVKEFTELQGIVGGLYARAQGLSATVADAIYDHYKPESMEDAVPRTLEGAVLSIADKADSIAGMFALGLQPTGSKDPFALRRQGNGIVKTMAEQKLPLLIDLVLASALQGYRGSEAERKFVTPGRSLANAEDFSCLIADFFRERLEFYLRDVLGFKYDEVNAVLAAISFDGDLAAFPFAGNVVDTLARLEAVAAMRGSEDFESISVSFKRIKNILRQATEEKKAPAKSFDPQGAREPAERELGTRMPEVAAKVDRLRRAKDYRQALVEVSRLRPLVDTFFDKVMVMVEDERVRGNRLALLQKLLNDFSTIADFSEIVTEKGARDR